MQETLLRKLHNYIRENNPDLLLTLQEQHRVSDYLRENVASVDGLLHQLLAANKAPSVMEELCMEELTRPLKPSRFHYIKDLLEEEFPAIAESLQQRGVLTTELINMIAVCDPVFDELHFSMDTEEDRMLRYALMGVLYEYLNGE